MNLILIRHADALPIGANGSTCDEDRPLSDEGWKQAADLGNAFLKRKITFDLIISSPLVRTMQTTLKIQKVLGIPDSLVEARDELAPGGRPKKLARCLNGLQGSSIALVGHQPDLSLYAGWMIGEKDVQLQFAKGGAALIQIDGSVAKFGGLLRWLITPEWTMS